MADETPSKKPKSPRTKELEASGYRGFEAEGEAKALDASIENKSETMVRAPKPKLVTEPKARPAREPKARAARAPKPKKPSTK